MLERIRNQITELRKEEERRYTYEAQFSLDFPPVFIFVHTFTGTVRASDYLHFVCLSSFGWRTYFSFTHSEKKMQVLSS